LKKSLLLFLAIVAVSIASLGYVANPSVPLPVSVEVGLLPIVALTILAYVATSRKQTAPAAVGTLKQGIMRGIGFNFVLSAIALLVMAYNVSQAISSVQSLIAMYGGAFNVSQAEIYNSSVTIGLNVVASQDLAIGLANLIVAGICGVIAVSRTNPYSKGWWFGFGVPSVVAGALFVFERFLLTSAIQISLTIGQLVLSLQNLMRQDIISAEFLFAVGIALFIFGANRGRVGLPGANPERHDEDASTRIVKGKTFTLLILLLICIVPSVGLAAYLTIPSVPQPFEVTYSSTMTSFSTFSTAYSLYSVSITELQTFTSTQLQFSVSSNVTTISPLAANGYSPIYGLIVDALAVVLVVFAIIEVLLHLRRPHANVNLHSK